MYLSFQIILPNGRNQALPDQTAETVSNALIDTVISRFGVPLEIHSDQARNSESNIFQQVLKTLGLKKTRTTALHPQSDGMVERFNRTALDYLAKSVDSDHKNWDKLLPILLLSYRSAVHETTKQTPALMIMGRELRLPGDLMFKRPSAADDNTTASNYVEQLIENLHITHELARENLQQSTDRMETRYNTKAKGCKFVVGDLVWLFDPKRKKGLSPKLQSDWVAPFEVLEVISRGVI